MQVDIEVIRSGDIDRLRESLGNSRGVESALERFVNSSAMVAQSFAELNAPKKTKKLMGGIERDKADKMNSGAIQAAVGVQPVAVNSPANEDYPYFVHQGTGLFGKYHKLIRPVRAKAMVFFGRTGWVVAKTVKGQRPQPYMGDAFHELQTIIPHQIDGLVDDILGGRH